VPQKLEQHMAALKLRKMSCIEIKRLVPQKFTQHMAALKFCKICCVEIKSVIYELNSILGTYSDRGF